MADSGIARPQPARPAADRFGTHAIELVLDHVSGDDPAGEPWRFGPLVLISPDETAASAAVAARIGDRGQAVSPGTATLYPGATLDRDLAAALAEDRVDRLAATLAASRLIIVDRIDRVADVDRQVALVHLLDTVMAAGGIWVVSLPMHPTAVFVPQCGSRLGGGLVVPLAAPTMDHVAQVPAAISMQRIIRAAARLHDVPTTAVVGPSRHRSVVAARSLAMYLARRLTGRSFQAIGTACGGRDHTTVLHGVRVCGARLVKDPAFAADVAELSAALVSRQPSAGPRRPAVDSPPLPGPLRGRHHGRRDPA